MFLYAKRRYFTTDIVTYLETANSTKRKMFHLIIFFFLIFEIFGCTCSMQTFLGQGLNLGQNHDNTLSLTIRPSGNSREGLKVETALEWGFEGWVGVFQEE